MKSTEVASLMEWSQTTVSRLETGHTAVRTLDIERLCELYRADEKTTASLLALAPQTRTQGWWRAYSEVIPPWLDLLLDLEQATSRFSWYEAQLVPGIFQTARYTTAVMHRVAASVAEMRLKLRMERQALLTRQPDPPQYDVLLDESVLRRPIGTPDVIMEQLNCLITMSELPNVSLQVLPYSAGYHDGLASGPFVIMDFPQGGMAVPEPSTVYLEGFASATYLDKPQAVTEYVDAFNGLRGYALDEKASRDLIAQITRSLR